MTSAMLQQQRSRTVVVEWLPLLDYPYTSIRTLGEGTYGTVTLEVLSTDVDAYRRGDDKVPRFAVKRFKVAADEDEDAVAADATREVRNLMLLKKSGGACDTGVACLIDHFIDERDGLYVLVTRFEPGVTLRQLSANNDKRRFTVDGGQLRRILRSALAGLRYMHAHDVVHRDIKDDNLIVQNYGTASVHVVYLDPGLGCVDRADCVAQNVSVEVYLSPELLTRRLHNTGADATLAEFKAADVWTLALVVRGVNGAPFPNQEKQFELLNALKLEYAAAAQRVERVRIALALRVAHDVQQKQQQLQREQRRHTELATRLRQQHLAALTDMAAQQRTVFADRQLTVLDSSLYFTGPLLSEPSGDSTSNEVLGKMLRFNWRQRLSPLAGMMLLDRRTAQDPQRLAPLELDALVALAAHCSNGFVLSRVTSAAAGTSANNEISVLE